jgi:catechol 2,3-dioxygenase-like lactoylglutathione lyase family enzyme
MIGRWHGLNIDCPDPDALAVFYQELLGMERVEDSADYVVIGGTSGLPMVVFQRTENYRRPSWPRPDTPAQMHFDVLVEDLDAAEPRVLALGATLLDGSDKPIGYRVYADPVGHPFCLITPEPTE